MYIPVNASLEKSGHRQKTQAYLLDALRRLDQWLIRICDEEERRAKMLVGDGSGGWEGVRNMLLPQVEQLVFLENPVDAGLLPPGDHPLQRIGQALALQPCESEALLVLLAAYLEPRYQSVYAVLQDNLKQPRPTERLLLSVLGRTPARHGILSASLAESGTLIRSGFLAVEEGSFPPLDRPFSLPDEVLGLLLGATTLRPAGSRVCQWLCGQGSDRKKAPVCVIHGEGNRTALARDLAEADERLLLVRLPERLREAENVARASWRIGIAAKAIPLLDMDALCGEDSIRLGRIVDSLARDMGGRAWLLNREPLPLARPHTECRPDRWSQRRQNWLDEADRNGFSLSAADAGRLASRHRLSGSEIRLVFQAMASPEVASLDRIACSMGHTTVRHSMLTLTGRNFDDLVVRETTRDALERLIFFVENRDRLAERFDLHHRFQLQRGPVVLFAGSSGTGKTLAAEAVAARIDRPLYTVDIASLVSKYIGDTEKHVDEILGQAERASAVLLFDEADILFSTRTEKTSTAGEQFANMVVGYLLQRIELHDGLVILATNLRHAIDDAFLRRFQFRIEFPMPEAKERLRIWKLMLPAGLKRGPDIDLARLAQQHRLTGGEIRNAALKAIFLARQKGHCLGQDHLEQSVALELLEQGRISRLTAGERTGDAAAPDRGSLLRSCVEAIRDLVEDRLQHRFLNEIHIVHGSPTEERLAGKRPAVSIALFRLAGKRGNSGLRAGFILSAWSQHAEEEYELLGVVHETLLNTSLQDNLPAEHSVTIRIQESHDFDLLYRFWSSHGHPVRASIVMDVEID